MTEPGTAVAAGRLLPAACLPPALPVHQPGLSLGHHSWGLKQGEVGGEFSPSPSPCPPAGPCSLGQGGRLGIQAGWEGRGEEETCDEGFPWGSTAGQLLAEG